LEPLQALETLEIAIETHQAPAIGDRQGCQVGIGSQTGRQPTVPQQLVKHLPSSLMLPVVNCLAVMAVVRAGQRQPHG